MAEIKKKTKLGDINVGQQPGAGTGAVSNAPLQDNAGGKPKLSPMPMAKTQIGGYDLVKEGGTVTLGRAMQEEATKSAGEAALERLRKRNTKP